MDLNLDKELKDKIKSMDHTNFEMLNTPMTDFTRETPADLTKASDNPFWPTLSELGKYRRDAFFKVWQEWLALQSDPTNPSVWQFCKDKKEELSQIMQLQIPIN
jgi:hypothetical protein